MNTTIRWRSLCLYEDISVIILYSIAVIQLIYLFLFSSLMLFKIKCSYKYNIYNFTDWSCRRHKVLSSAPYMIDSHRSALEAHCGVNIVSRSVGKPTDLVNLELTAMSFAGIRSTTELPVHIGQVGSWQNWSVISSCQLLLPTTSYPNYYVLILVY